MQQFNIQTEQNPQCYLQCCFFGSCPTLHERALSHTLQAQQCLLDMGISITLARLNNSNSFNKYTNNNKNYSIFKLFYCGTLEASTMLS